MTADVCEIEADAEDDVGKEGGRLRLMSVRIEVDAKADVGKEGRRIGG